MIKLKGLTMTKRDKIINLTKRFLTGPLFGENETLDYHPLILYSVGILFPRDIGVEDEEELALLLNTKTKKKSEMELDRDEDSYDNKGKSTLYENDDDASISMNRKAFYHSSNGASFSLKKDQAFKVTTSYYTYSYENLGKDKDDKPIEKYSLNPKIFQSFNSIDYNLTNKTSIPLDSDNMLKLKILCFEENEKTHYTVILYNDNRAGNESGRHLSKFDNSIINKIIFRPKIEIEVMGSSAAFFEPKKTESKTIATFNKHDEMLYRKHLSFSKGLNCATFESISEDHCTKIETVHIPEITFPVLSTDLESKYSKNNSEILTMETILNRPHEDILKLLKQFSNSYETWINELNDNIPFSFEKEAKENLEECRITKARIDDGISMLSSIEIFQIWKDANYVVNEQFHYSKKDIKFKWKPFQLGFFLLSIPGIINPNHKDRNFADLLWVTTGGGKTEAYLAIIAFTIFYRRWKYKKAGIGLSVISRYTLRLLTSQQFERASALICAMELLRRKKEISYGKDSIVLGLFVGGDATPNKLEDSTTEGKSLKGLLDKIESDKYNPFPLKHCPKCKAELCNTDKNYDDPNSTNSFLYLRVNNRRTFIIKCLNKECNFHNTPIPVDFVDESLMKKKPSILISTIDKYAMFPFKANDYTDIFLSPNAMPVDLIIQDELHLINSALGSIFGSYETALHTILENKQDYPEHIENYKIKIIASTATPKNAKSQLGLLFNRKYSVFPPPGTDIDDSFFTHFEKNENGRKYLGFLPNGIPQKTFARDINSVILLVSSVMDAKLFKEDQNYFYKWDDVENNYYRLLTVYFNSLKELGGFSSMINDDIPKRLSFLYAQFVKLIKSGTFDLSENKELLDSVNEQNPMYRELDATELTGRISGDVLSKSLKKLSGKESSDILVSTNMISVGIDIARLNLMTVMGQPKYTSEYIQASSRTGRDPKVASGVVLTVYNPARIRDVSHYEFFYSYHQSIYKYVEPITVTPFSSPVLERTLHAQIISIARFLIDQENNNNTVPDNVKYLLNNLHMIYDKIIQNQDFNILRKFKDSIEERVRNLSKDNVISEKDKNYYVQILEDHIIYLEKFFRTKIDKSISLGVNALNYAYIPGTLRFQGNKIQNKEYLIKFAGESELRKININDDTKETMTSMRNVAQDCRIMLVDEKRTQR
jgi:hypothetical protein